MSWDFSQFHFIRPLWLLGIPIVFILWLLLTRSLKTTYWEAHLNKQILDALRVSTSTQSKFGHWLLLAAWIIACFAVAGPAWQKQAVPSFQNNSAMVIVLDLSVSMLAEDLAPNRLAQAKYKLIDILRLRKDGQTALIAYSGDAHTVTPLTDDPVAIEALLPALHPNIMPVKGSNTEAAIELASQLLSGSGNIGGDILLITDGVSEAAEQTVISLVNGAYSLSILGVGNSDATPIPLQGGGFLRSEAGEIILSSLDNQQLANLAAKSNGSYRQITISDNDIRALISNDFEALQQTNLANNGSSTLYDNWVDMGHWLAILLLPFAALYFRKGIVYLLPLGLMLPPDANAFEWQDLWQTKDQQAQKLLDQNPQAAAEKFERKDWSGVANYQAKNYPSAAEQFSSGETANDHYNRGNALALNGTLDEALQAYEQALELEPDFADALYNKDIVEKLIEQQEQNQQQSENSEQQSDENSQQDSSQENQDSESENQQSDGSQQEQADGSQDQQADGSQQEQADGSQEEQAEGSQEEQADGSQDQQESDQQAQSEGDEQEESAEQTQASQAEEANDDSEQESETSTAMLSEATPDQLQDSSEQWLRGIQDDPSGFLRRKFEYQTWLRSRQGSSSQNNSSDERY